MSDPTNAPPTPPANPILNVPDDLVPEAWKDHVRDLRRENKSLRELSKASADEIERRSQDTIKKNTEEYEGKLKSTQSAADERYLRSELKAEAIKAGMIDLDGLKLADLSKVTLKEDGTVDGAETMLEDLKKAKPYLFGSVQNSSTPANPPNPKPPTAKKATEMTAEEYAAARKQIK